MEKFKAITIGFDYSVTLIAGVRCLVHLFDSRIKAIRISKKNRTRINRLGEGHFTYGECVQAVRELVEVAR